VIRAAKLIVNARDYPGLDVTVEYIKPLRFRGDSFDELPPAIAMLKPDGQPWTDPPPGGVFNPGPHSSQGGPFVCMRGAREYHTHSGHLNDKNCVGSCAHKGCNFRSRRPED